MSSSNIATRPSAGAAPSPPPLAAAALEIAASQVGVSEDPPGSNRGAEVERYLASVGLPPGAPWCIAFLHWCFDRAALRLGAPNPLPRTGSSSALYRWAKAARRLSPLPARGGLFLVRGGPTGHKHGGLVVSSSDGWFETIEGNANTAGGAEGIAVMRRRRRAAASDFVRLSD